MRDRRAAFHVPKNIAPSIADLTPHNATGRVMATLTHRRDNGNAGSVCEIPAIVAGGATAVQAHIESGPVVDRSYGRSFCVGPRREIRGGSLSCHAESGEGDGSEQKTLHRYLQFHCASLLSKLDCDANWRRSRVPFLRSFTEKIR